MKIKLEPKATPMILLITEEKQEVKKGLAQFWNKIKKDIEIKGFRKGKASRKQAESHYGMLNLYKPYLESIYFKALEEHKLEVVVWVVSNILLGNLNPDQDISIEVTLYLRPEVKLADLDSIQIKKEIVQVLEDEVSDRINNIANTKAEFITVNREAKIGDVINIDFIGTVNGKEFQGSKGEDFSYELGSNKFIDNFDDKITALKAFETKTIQLTFPDNYMVKDLQGQTADFQVTVNKVQMKLIPIVSDEWVKETFKKDSLQIYREEVLNVMFTERERMAEEKLMRDIVTRITKESQVGPIPDEIVRNELQIEWDNYLLRCNKSEEQMLKEQPHARSWFFQTHKQRIIEGLNTTMVLFEIAKQYDIQVSESEIEDYINKKINQLTPDQKDNFFKAIKEKTSDYNKIRQSLVNKTTMDFVLDKCTVK